MGAGPQDPRSACAPQPKTPEMGMDFMQDLTEKTIALLRKASDFAAAAYDSDLTEIVVEGRKVNAITLELELRTLAGKLEHSARRHRARAKTHA